MLIQDKDFNINMAIATENASKNSTKKPYRVFNSCRPKNKWK